jgi:regulator of Ty1 transposition protein 103
MAKLGGGSVFSSSASTPAELVPLIAPQQVISKYKPSISAAIKTATSEFDKLSDPDMSRQTKAPVYAARLTGLMKTLSTTEGAVAECVKARRELVRALERLLESNKEDLGTEEERLRDLGARKTIIESKKREVEQDIIKTMSISKSPEPANYDGQIPANTEPDRPQVEALTPPHVEDDSTPPEQEGSTTPNGYSTQTNVSQPQQEPFLSAPGIEMLSNLASQYQAVPLNGSHKKRKLDETDDFPNMGGDDGIDPEVTEMLRNNTPHQIVPPDQGQPSA